MKSYRNNRPRADSAETDSACQSVRKLNDLLESLSIVVPAYNEETRIAPTLEKVSAFLRQQNLPFAELIVVDDGSTDRTIDVVQSFAATDSNIRLIRNGRNRGKGYSVRAGMLAAEGSWILCSDADLSAPIEELQTLAEAVRDHDAAVAIGSRALDRSLIQVRQPFAREWSGRAFNLVMRAVTGLPFRDTQCGFKLFRQDAAQDVFRRQQFDGFSFDVENLYLAHTLGYRCVEAPVRWADAKGSKVSLTSGLTAFVDLIRIRLWHAGCAQESVLKKVAKGDQA